MAKRFVVDAETIGAVSNDVPVDQTVTHLIRGEAPCYHQLEPVKSSFQRPPYIYRGRLASRPDNDVTVVLAGVRASLKR